MPRYCFTVGYDLDKSDDPGRTSLEKVLREWEFKRVLDSQWIANLEDEIDLDSLRRELNHCFKNKLRHCFKHKDSKLLICQISCKNLDHIHIPWLDAWPPESTDLL